MSSSISDHDCGLMIQIPKEVRADWYTWGVTCYGSRAKMFNRWTVAIREGVPGYENNPTARGGYNMTEDEVSKVAGSEVTHYCCEEENSMYCHSSLTQWGSASAVTTRRW